MDEVVKKRQLNLGARKYQQVAKKIGQDLSYPQALSMATELFDSVSTDVYQAFLDKEEGIGTFIEGVADRILTNRGLFPEWGETVVTLTISQLREILCQMGEEMDKDTH